MASNRPSDSAFSEIVVSVYKQLGEDGKITLSPDKIAYTDDMEVLQVAVRRRLEREHPLHTYPTRCPAWNHAVLSALVNARKNRKVRAATAYRKVGSR